MPDTALRPNSQGFLTYKSRDIGYGIEKDFGEYTFRGHEDGKLVFDSVVTDNLWNVIVRDTGGGIRGDFAIIASTPAAALHDAARSLAHDQTGARNISLQFVASQRIYLFEDEILEWHPTGRTG